MVVTSSSYLRHLNPDSIRVFTEGIISLKFAYQEM